MKYDRDRLIGLVRQQALEFGEFVLASGKTARFYLDCRRLTLDSAGAIEVAAGVMEKLDDDWPDAVGGMAIGADPITGAVITHAAHLGRSMKGFIVRKQVKTHGTQRFVEGPVQPGDRAVILEDVVTTGGSSLEAIKRAREFGLQVTRVIAIIDRLEGAAESFGRHDIPFTSLLTIRDLGISA